MTEQLQNDEAKTQFGYFIKRLMTLPPSDYYKIEINGSGHPSVTIVTPHGVRISLDPIDDFEKIPVTVSQLDNMYPRKFCVHPTEQRQRQDGSPLTFFDNVVRQLTSKNPSLADELLVLSVVITLKEIEKVMSMAFSRIV